MHVMYLVRKKGLAPQLRCYHAGPKNAPIGRIFLTAVQALLLMHAMYLVRKKGLEPPRLAALEPKSSASASSATSATYYFKKHKEL